ncbi:hypothetical protein P7H22_26645 [Paenibacillus larvae]|nr:hypothetical protein [Paenibacillus larvae]MDT2243184.1 hypothetical protein [Paenibacillus larvae]
MPITKLNIQTAGKAVVGTVLSNQEVTTGFYFREIGIRRTVRRRNPLRIWELGGKCGIYPSAGGADVVEKSIDVIVIVGNAQTVTAEIDKSLVYRCRRPGTSQKRSQAVYR